MTKLEKVVRDLAMRGGSIGTYYSDSDQLMVIASYKEGKLHGDHIIYYRNGVIQTLTPYVKGKIEGCRKDFREDGSLWIECDYRCGKEVEKRVYENDKIIKVFNYKRGKFVGGFDYKTNEEIPVVENTYRKKTEEEEHQEFLASILVNGKYQPRNNKELKTLCKDTKISLKDIDTSLLSDFSFAFMDSKRTNEEFAGIEDWDLSNAKNIEGMFFSATHFNRDISSWNVSGIKNFSQVFFNASSFSQSLEKWDMSSAEDLSLMFCLADSYTHSLDNWKVPNLKKSFYLFGKDEARALPSWAV